MKLWMVSAECGTIALLPNLLAEVTPLDVPWWANLSSQAVLSGLCAFLVVKAIPAKDEATRQERKSERDDFRDALVKLSDRFLAELTAGREQFLAESKATREELLSTLGQLLGELREAREFYAKQAEIERASRREDIHTLVNKAQTKLWHAEAERLGAAAGLPAAEEKGKTK